MQRACLVLMLSTLVASGCVDTLPEQDLRIYEAVPVEKLSADILWQEYQADADAADRRYWGRAIEVTGVVTTADSDAVNAYVMFGQTEDAGIQARTLDEAAPDIVAAATVGERLTLKCFCAGLEGDLMLTSCILPR